MTYTIKIPHSDTHKWQSFKQWNMQEQNYREFLISTYPEIVDIRVTWNSPIWSEITFKSEQHYHWFLLKQ